MGAMAKVTGEEVERRDAFLGRLFEANIITMEVLTIYLGDRLGLYRALAEEGGVTPAELASRTGTHGRYVREWLEQQAVSGILDVEDTEAEPAARRYSLPSGHAEVLLDRDSLNYLMPVTRISVGLTTVLPALVEAFRNGGGVSWADYGADALEGQADGNRPLFINLLGTEWLPAIPDVHARLLADPPARVADIACGAGWSSIAIAQAYPKAQVDGFDLDDASIDMARKNAEDEGVNDRVTFAVHDASDPGLIGSYHLVTVFEALHDMSRPVEVLGTIRGLLADGAIVIIADERVPEKFTAPGDDMDRLYYGWSVLCCLPAGMSEQPSAATGTIMRPSILRRYASEAGFNDVEILPIEHDLWRFYRLRV